MTAIPPSEVPSTGEPPSSGWVVGSTRFGFRIEQFLGSGSLGVVYRAIDPQGRRVALKTFTVTAKLSAAASDVLLRETTLYSRLAHANIVKMLDAGVFGTQAWIAMELVEGRALAAHRQVTKLLPPGAVLKICARVASALAHAHGRGIVHRDVKPDNILIDWPGPTVKLADFGIASLGDAFSTQTGVVPGTPYYMAPEQLCGGVIDGRTDLYALGVMLFETLSGRRPHTASSLGALLRQVASDDAPVLCDVRPEIPAAISDLVGRLLARQPSLRPGEAAAVAVELDRMASDFPATDDGPMSQG